LLLLVVVLLIQLFTYLCHQASCLACFCAWERLWTEAKLINKTHKHQKLYNLNYSESMTQPCNWLCNCPTLCIQWCSKYHVC